MLRGCAGSRSAGSAALAATLAVGLATACFEGGADKSRSHAASRPVVVELVRVEPEPLRDVIQLVGQLEAERSVLVQPEVAGRLESIEFAEGQAVEAGAVLFRLHDEEQRARLRVAQAEFSLTKTTFERTKKLATRDISSAAQFDRAAAELARERARVELARVELERMTIRAPFDGLMGALFISPGARIEPDDILVQIDAISRLQLVFTLPEVAVSLARPGVPVDFSVAAYPGESFSGEVYFVSPTLDPDTRRLLVKAWVPNPDRRLRPGLFATIRVEVGRREDALLVPEAALVLDREGTFVWRVGADGAAERASVKSGLRVGGRVEIVEGLRARDVVVSAGTNKVRAGSIVRAPEEEGGAPDVRKAAEAAERRGEGS